MSFIKSLDKLILPNDIIINLSKIYFSKGRQNYHESIIKSDINVIINQTIEKDIFYFTKIIGFKISENRLKILSNKNIIPKNKQEKTVLNLKKTFKNIFMNYKSFEFTTNEYQSIHKVVFHDLGKVGFKKSINGRSKRLILDETFEQVSRLYENDKYEKLLLSILTFIDVYNIKAFSEYNEFSSLLLLQLFLMKLGFKNFHYTSIFEYIYFNINDYRIAIAASTFNYEEGISQPLYIIRFFLKALTKTSLEMEQIVRNHDFDKGLNKSYSIENTIYKLSQVFTKEDIRKKHPYVSDSTINRTLNRLKDKKIIRPLGKGRSARWIKIKSPEKFQINEQLTLEDLF